MKTLINKANPAIRITAPDIKEEYSDFFGSLYTLEVAPELVLYADDWTLVEEEPLKISDLTWEDINTLEKLINNVHYEFRNGIGEESFGKEVLEKFREIKGIDVDGVEEEPVDLEKEIEMYLKPITYADIRIEPFNSLEKCARHFYELGRKGGKV